MFIKNLMQSHQNIYKHQFDVFTKNCAYAVLNYHERKQQYYENLMVCSQCLDTDTDKKLIVQSYLGGVSIAQIQKPTQIPIGFCANLSLSVVNCLSLRACFGVGQCGRVITFPSIMRIKHGK